MALWVIEVPAYYKQNLLGNLDRNLEHQKNERNTDSRGLAHDIPDAASTVLSTWLEVIRVVFYQESSCILPVF